MQKENQRRKRRSRRSSLHACSAPTEVNGSTCYASVAGCACSEVPPLPLCGLSMPRHGPLNVGSYVCHAFLPHPGHKLSEGARPCSFDIAASALQAAVTSGLSEQDIEQPSEGHAGCNDMTWNASPINTQSVGGSQVHPVNTAQLQALHNADMCMADKSDFPDASPESDQHSPM